MLRQPLLRLLWTILFLLLFPLRATAASLPALDRALDQSRAQAKTLVNKGAHAHACNRHVPHTVISLALTTDTPYPCYLGSF